MKQVQIYQCDYCKRTSFHKSNLRKHEKECFYNPETQSYATCLWFSRANGLDYTSCFINKFLTPQENEKPKLKIGCKHWLSIDIIEDYDIFEDKQIWEKLMKGDKSFFKNLPPREDEPLEPESDMPW